MATGLEAGESQVHLYGFNPNPGVLTWQRLEYMRLKQLGISNRYSRHFNVTRSSPRMKVATPTPKERERNLALSAYRDTGTDTQGDEKVKVNNSVAPFATLGKPTCGFFFTTDTDNRKRNFGIPASDLVKWRTAQYAS